jgi:feruloyl esterase
LEELSMTKCSVLLVVLTGLAGGAFAQKSGATPRSCASLAQLSLAGAKISSTQVVPAGTFTSPVKEERPESDAPLFKTVPEFCRVMVEAKPSGDSDIKVEVWLPTQGWNGKFQGQGNGGFAGSIDYHMLAIAVLRGYATAATDTGHSGTPPDASWALNHPEKIIDFGYRGIHEMTRIGKATTAAYYTQAAQYSYFGSCSNGGREALMEAQRYPEDYDGILAGAPANYWTHLIASSLWDAQVTTLDPASYIPSSKLPAIARAVNEACDALDGVKDGVLNDPRQCHFDPNTLLCKAAESDSCLTAPQAVALQKLYEGAHDSHGRQIFPGFLPGAEEGPMGWAQWITGPAPGKALLFYFEQGYFSNLVYDKSDWDFKSAKLDASTKASDDRYKHVLNATDPNLKKFRDRGGKLILYHGWNDPAIAALNTINYFNSVVTTMGSDQAESFLRLYMVPGMQHCGFGPGADSFGQPGSRPAPDPQHNLQLSLEQWVAKGIAPGSIIAAKYAKPYPSMEVTMTRPLCPYPQVAKYKGSGDSNDAANFTCAEETKK